MLSSGPELNHRKAKVAWEDVCYPKIEGGLGFRPLKDGNLVFGLRTTMMHAFCLLMAARPR